MFLPRRTCLVLWFFLFSSLVPCDRGSLSIKHHPQSQALFVDTRRCAQKLPSAWEIQPFKAAPLELPGCSPGSQSPFSVDTPVTSHVLMALLYYFSCLLQVLNVIVTNNHVSGTAQDVGQPWLCVTGGKIEASTSWGFSRITGKFARLKRIKDSWVVCSGSSGTISHTSCTTDLSLKYLMTSRPIKIQQFLIFFLKKKVGQDFLLFYLSSGTCQLCLYIHFFLK